MSRRAAQNHCIAFLLWIFLAVHYRLSAAEKGEDDDFGVSDHSADVKNKKEVLRTAAASFFTKVNGSH